MNNQDIQNLIKATIEANVVQALNTIPEAIDKLVKAALEKPVDKNGRNDGWSSDRMPYLDWLAGEEIRSAARSAVRKVIQERTENIEQAIRNNLTQDSIVSAITRSLIGATEQDWRIDVTFAADKDKD